MYKLASCCLLFIGFLNPLFSLPLLDSGEVSLQLSAPHEDAPLTSEELERASLLQILPEMLLGAERGDSLRKADSSTNIFNPRGNLRKFQDFSGQDPDILLSHLLARIRKPYKKRETPDCFWKYCV
ncbi:urotensin-2 isoform X2 [Macaca nemestrina]|uniref:Urotensin-2 n=2 Tax=Macaca TaxID=9539 RepID=UTS2_MACMU|nr:urotensin-2 precursor [Macaca mulatta]XP_005544950.1 urotensin-2 isoform X1 [Macaca fascicularis]Q8HYC2.1 RecName: Full=Urotensin-2; AltName: Full=Urotensin II; Short=U-II; Short=UII; Flags: Precursor [Macaca mulatta]AAL55429.1 urotensin-II [Macaca mulatta]EHH49507.1 Urotensin II [Macaca fascicularis]